MNRDTILVGVAAIINMVAVTLTWVTVHDVPDVLGSSLTALVGATAALAYTSRKAPTGPTGE